MGQAGASGGACVAQLHRSGPTWALCVPTPQLGPGGPSRPVCGPTPPLRPGGGQWAVCGPTPPLGARHGPGRGQRGAYVAQLHRWGPHTAHSARVYPNFTAKARHGPGGSQPARVCPQPYLSARRGQSPRVCTHRYPDGQSRAVGLCVPRAHEGRQGRAHQVSLVSPVRYDGFVSCRATQRQTALLLLCPARPRKVGHKTLS